MDLGVHVLKRAESTNIPVTHLSEPAIIDFLDIFERHPWVYSCITKTAEAVASVPFTISRNGMPAPDHYLSKLFSIVNDYTTVYDFWYQLVIYLEATGNFFAEIEHEGDIPVALHVMNPAYVTINPHPTKRIESYTYTANGTSVTIPADKVIHIFYPNPKDPFWGLPPLKPLLIDVASDLFARNYNKRFFENDASVPAVLETDAIITEDEARAIQRMWQSAYGGMEKHHSVAVIWGGLKYKEMGTRPKDASFLEFIRNMRDEIVAVFKVPPAIVGIFEYANYANARVQRVIFWRDKVLPLLVKIQQAMNEFLIKRYDPECEGSFDMSVVNKELVVVEENYEDTRIAPPEPGEGR